jgi:hypothetical protein
VNKKNKKKLKPGDLVVLGTVGKTNSMVVWATWNDYDYSAEKFWPAIVGEFRRGDVALVLEIHQPEVGPLGAKICTQQNIVGWINHRCLIKLGGPAET